MHSVGSDLFIPHFWGFIIIVEYIHSSFSVLVK